jgi:hypothetical protein
VNQGTKCRLAFEVIESGTAARAHLPTPHRAPALPSAQVYLQSRQVTDLQAIHDRLSPLTIDSLRGVRMETEGR